MEVVSKEKVMSPVEWALTLFLVSLPLIGLILLLIWAFGDNQDMNKKNFAKGSLLLYVIGVILAFSFLFLLGGMAFISNFF